MFMNRHFLKLFFCLIFSSVFSQKPNMIYKGRYTPAIRKEKLNEAVFIQDIMPEFKRYVALPAKNHQQLNDLLKLIDSPEGYHIFPQENNFYPRESFNKIINFVSMEITATSSGKNYTLQSNTEALSKAQKNLLSKTDFGTDIIIKINFKFKYQTKNTINEKELIQGEYRITLVPEIEAEYTGGWLQMSDFINQNLPQNLSKRDFDNKVRNAVVHFIVDENGQLMDVKLTRSSGDAKIDDSILKTFNKMPKWKPAKNLSGQKIKEVFNIPFESGGC